MNKRYTFYLSVRTAVRTAVALLLSAAFSLSGCTSEPEQDEFEKAMETADTTDAKLVTWHPILDAPIHQGDSLLIHLIALKDEGLLLEGDMTRLVGGFVRSHGGLENPDSVLLGMTYRQLIDRALLLDLSTEYGYNPADCEGCTDSILIFLPGTGARIYVGMGRKGLQEMIAEAFASEELPDRYREAPYDRKIDPGNWRETVDEIASQQEEIFDGVLFGNVMIFLGREGKNPEDYTYGRIMAVIDRVKEMPEFPEVRTYLTNLASDTTATTTPQ